MDFTKLDNLRDFLNNLGDDTFWEPFCNDSILLSEFNERFKIVKESRNWPAIRNKEKGEALENLMKFIFERFAVLNSMEKNKLAPDNEIDIDVDFNDAIVTNFICSINGKLICECKNKNSSSIDVGTVSKLVELCNKSHAGLGIFVSIKGLSKGHGGSMWKYSEGKRRKLYLSTGIPIISFKIDEIEDLKNEGKNFYTLIKQKCKYLIDEVDDTGVNLEHVTIDEIDFRGYLLENLNCLQKFQLITHNEKKLIIDRINKRYGD